MKIAHKGLILVAIPLIFELFFVATLFTLLKQAQLEAKKEAHSREVILTANHMMRHIVNAGTSAGGYALTHIARFDRDHSVTIKEALKEMRQLDDLLSGDPVQQVKLVTVKGSVDRAVDLIARLKSRADEESTLSALVGGPRAFGKVKSCVEQLNGDVNALIAGEKYAEQQSTSDRAKTRAQIQDSLSWGIGLNILVVIALTVFFSQGITRRLQVLADNSVRLSRRQPLNPLLSGSDEIAHLDRVFHSMVQGLEEADRLKQQLVSMVSHDLRTPLTSVEAILTYLEAGGMGELPEPIKQKLRAAEADIMALISLITDLLDVDKLEEGKLDLYFGEVSLQDVFERALRSLSEQAARKEIILLLRPTTLTVTGDEDRLVRVVEHILANAIKFSPAKSTVEAVSQDSPGYTEVRICDQGPGISAQDQESIFERFGRISETRAADESSAGLGLALSKAIIEKHGGAIGVISEEGKGSTFWFRLPKATTLTTNVRAHLSTS